LSGPESCVRSKSSPWTLEDCSIVRKTASTAIHDFPSYKEDQPSPSSLLPEARWARMLSLHSQFPSYATMLIVAPQIISILSHVTVLLFAILIAILSAWTVRRVRKASARSPFEFFPPVFADHKPVRRASERTIRSLPTAPVCKRSLSQGSILNIDTQSASPFGILARPQFPPVRQHRSYSVSPSCVSDQESEKSEHSAYSWNESDSEFGRWLIGNEKECNSPTGSLLDELDESDWLPSTSTSARRRRRNGRRIITILGIVRGMIAIPVVMLYAEYGFSGVSCLSLDA
jgi:hypothetical protein